MLTNNMYKYATSWRTYHPKNNWVENLIGTVLFVSFLVFFSHLVGLI